ncbi:DNA phosphorothioation-dependent restriction protein DptH [Massilia sp. NEAU-DD11]|uniref:DNA phosphorothioation-dependent restriction protein DptH n=1 Tax=Massilia cellulosiltytica TaxID=2683234 RepID=A0A7X3G5Q7_9BURK|nr:DNA phosphorothioation-dependent restriction protein DptH [Telluria cellulosilytica]MVW64176.1 DNA phosphorothioation-dependent restriction protein DptH [Telluria cellulosilytica]
MSARPFESYLVDLFIEWATDKAQPGFRYQFQSPDHNNASKLYDAYLARATGAIEPAGVELPFIACGNTRLIPVLHGENGKGFSENYISLLRDCVASRTADFADCALLIIHNSKLDTIINSAEDLAAEGRAWHPQVLKQRLEALSQGHPGSRNLLTCLLDDQLKYVVSEGATVFGFAPLYQAIAEGTIQLSKLGLFEDPLMASLNNSAQIRKRLEENRALRRRLEFETENYADQVEDRFREDFGSKFIREHFVDTQDWKTLTFGDFKQELDINRTQSLTLEDVGNANGKLVDRAKSATKAGRKDLSVLLELPAEATEGTFEISFLASDVTESELKVSQSSIAKDDISIKVGRAGGKRSRVEVRAPFSGEPVFFTLTLTRRARAENHQFRCLFLRQGAFFVDGFKNHFRIEPHAKRLTLQMEANRLVIADDDGPCFVSEDPQDVVDNTNYASVDFSRQANASEKIGFQIASGEQRLSFNIEGAAAEDTVTVPLIHDRDRYDRLFHDDGYRAEFAVGSNRLVIDNRESAVAGMRQVLLMREATMVAERVLHRSAKAQVRVDDLSEIDGDLHAAYDAWYAYLSARKTTPSLVSWGPEYRELTAAVTHAYERVLSTIPRDRVLTDAYKRLLRVGMVEHDGKEFITPFHPLNLAYHLQLVETIVADRKAGHDSFAALPDITRERLTAAGLIPFVYDGDNTVAHVSAMRENAFWLELIPQKESSFTYVRNLVRDKVTEFTEAYARLFSAGSRSTLILNVINMGPARELFMGLTDYFKKHRDDACAIHVNCYDDQVEFNEFDAFAECVSSQALRDAYQLGRGGVHDDADLLIDLIRSRLTYSKFKTPKDDEPLAYAHLAFFRNNAPVDVRPVRTESALSGVLCDGLIAGESAENIENAYFSCFGLRNVEVEPYQPLRLARLVGALMQPARETSSPYVGMSVGLAASTEFRELLTRSYDSALWTTIVDPKVTLDFFTSQRDVVLIHYSDQYTSSAGYDAITVTKQVDLFRRLLGKESLLSEFNAFNGEWLLKMLTANEKTRKERRGIIGAYKFVRSLLADSDITWVPLSVAEMIRVSGNVGLKMGGSDFSRGSQGYTRGAISDDVLFVGFRGRHMYLLPLEVKTGARPDYDKAVEQARELKRYLSSEILGPDTMAGKLYRGLFVRQVLMQVEKYRLYGVLTDADLQHLTPRREWWLKGDYTVAELTDYPAGVVLSHLDSETCFDASYRVEQDVMLIDLPIGLLDSLIDAASAEQIRALRAQCHVPAEYLLTEASYAPTPEAFNVAPEPEHTPEPEAPVEDGPAVPLNAAGGNLRIRVGESVIGQQTLYWEPTNTARFMNSNSGIIGTMGTGKTQFTKSVVTQLVRNQSQNVNGAPIGMLIFDYKSDYVDDAFIQATNAKKFQLSKLPYNPLSLFGDTPMLPLHTAAGFAETMARAYGLGAKQQLKLENLIIECYASAGIHPEDRSSWSKAAPTIEDVWQLFLSQEKVEEDSLYAALSKLARFKIFEPDAAKTGSLYDLITGVTVVELAGYPSEIQNLVVALTLDLFYAQMQKRGKPQVIGDFRQITKMILVDEADNFMSQNFPALRRILKEGREYGVGVILSTQDITHFKTAENDYSSYILSWVVHRVSQIKNADVKAIFNKDDRADQEQLMEAIRKLDKHYSLFIDGEKRIQKMRDSTFWELTQ